MQNSYDFIKSIEGRPLGNLVLDEHFLRSPTENVFFIFVEKAGCTLLKSILIDQMIGDYKNIDPKYYYSIWSERNVIHALSHELLRVDGRQVLTSSNPRLITFCRNPYTRFLSAYRDKIVNPPTSELDYFQWIRREVLFWKLRQSQSPGRLTKAAAAVSLLDFAAFVLAQPPAARDKHWAEQHLLNLVDVVPPHVVVRLEDFDTTFPEIWKSTIGTDLPDISAIDRNSTARSAAVLDEETARLIHAIYVRDFELFGYDKESWRSL